MKSPEHVFHTKHDFKPELGWAAFQLLADVGPNGVSPVDLQAIAKTVGSPLAKLSNLSKLLSAMQDVGILERLHGKVCLSKAGRALANGVGCYETGFRAAVHCLYAWKWIWDPNAEIASPSWSYREVLTQLLNASSVGIDSDEIVLRLVSTAEATFGTVKVSFSRSSVSGVTMWLESQALPLITKERRRVVLQNSSTAMADTMRLHLAALCAHCRGETTLDNGNMQLLAESLLIRTDELARQVADFTRDSEEFLLVPAVPNLLIFRGSDDPFIEWLVRSAVRK